MKKLNSISVVLCIVFISAFTSCKKAIEVQPLSTITSSSFWTKPDDVTGGLRGMYLALRTPDTHKRCRSS